MKDELVSVWKEPTTSEIAAVPDAREPRVAGIRELDVTETEPILIDEISIALGSGPNGYRATFNDIEAYGVSNMSVVGVR
jgi:hypothetical protein